MYRDLRWVVEDAARDAASPTVVGNPGRGALAYLPRATRTYTSLEVMLERAGAGPLSFLISYALSRNHGNYTGLFATDYLAPTGNVSPQFDLPETTVQATGLLPNDRTHVLKGWGSYRLPFGLTVGAAAIVASGTPLTEFGWSDETYLLFVRPRGTAGRTPATINVDLRFAYDVPTVAGGIRPRLLLDVFNLGNRRQPVAIDQLHYTTEDRSAVNPNYGAVTRYQAPLRVRLGLVVDF